MKAKQILLITLAATSLMGCGKITKIANRYAVPSLREEVTAHNMPYDMLAGDYGTSSRWVKDQIYTQRLKGDVAIENVSNIKTDATILKQSSNYKQQVILPQRQKSALNFRKCGYYSTLSKDSGTNNAKIMRISAPVKGKVLCN